MIAEIVKMEDTLEITKKKFLKHMEQHGVTFACRYVRDSPSSEFLMKIEYPFFDWSHNPNNYSRVLKDTGETVGDWFFYRIRCEMAEKRHPHYIALVNLESDPSNVYFFIRCSFTGRSEMACLEK